MNWLVTDWVRKRSMSSSNSSTDSKVRQNTRELTKLLNFDVQECCEPSVLFIGATRQAGSASSRFLGFVVIFLEAADIGEKV
jgi:hypothetical protein